MDLKKKTIVLAMTPDMEIFKSFINNLEALEFSVVLICDETPYTNYKNTFDRLKSNFIKKIFNDKKYKANLFKQYAIDDNLQKLNIGSDLFDYSLIIRADVFDNSIIQKILEKSKENYCYHWDGLSRHPKTYNLINLFTKFYVFDKQDLSISKTFPATNFYFDCYSKLFEDVNIEYDVYFVGSNDTRIERLITLCEYLKSQNLKLKIILSGEIQDWLKRYDYLTFVNKPISYEENLINVSKSRILLDINHLHLHKGLSFRTFEALGYNKKLLTTNEEVYKYDFYNENNIFVIDNNLNEIKSFLEKPYSEIDEKIKHNYSFTSWINYILQIKNN